MSASLAQLMLLVVSLSVMSAPVAAGPSPTGLRCEWVTDNPAVRDSHPELFWEADAQRAWQVQVAASEEELATEGAPVWDSGRVESPLPIAEYAGEPLRDGQTYHWRVRLWGGEPEPGEWSPAARFTMEYRPLPALREHIRTFVNFGSNDAEMLAARYDLSFRPAPNQVRPQYIGLAYSLMATMVVPSEKHDDLGAWCVAEGLSEEGVPEEMFCHFREDTEVTLHVGAERAENPRETRTVPGWDPANDGNGDGLVNEQEAAELANPEAAARRMSQARVPIYYWGPPRDDFVMNIGHPDYQRYLAERYMPTRLEGGYDGFFVDTITADIPGPGRSGAILEYPRGPGEERAWLRDMQMALARVKIALPGSVLIANGWSAQPFVIDGAEREGWLNITQAASALEARLQRAADVDARGKVQLLQFNPIYVEGRSEFGHQVPIELERDAIFGLAAYYLCAGDHTYYGYGRHPYGEATGWYFPAIEFDVGEPLGPYESVVAEAGDEVEGENLLANGDFERDEDGDGLPDGWQTAQPLVLDEETVHSGSRSVRIDSDDVTINNINRGYVSLKPDTAYTLGGWMKTSGIEGGQGAQLYVYDFEDAQGAGIGIVMHGTHDWTRVQQVFRTASDAEGRVTFRVYGSTGTAWFDDLRLVEGAHVEEKLLRRRFTNALVLVRPAMPALGWGDDTMMEYPLDGSYRPLQADGTLAEPVPAARLRLGEAAILIAEE
ncbi:MAG: putative glycoside hydrolase [Armatimonadota bacterium]